METSPAVSNQSRNESGGLSLSLGSRAQFRQLIKTTRDADVAEVAQRELVLSMRSDKSVLRRICLTTGLPLNFKATG